MDYLLDFETRSEHDIKKVSTLKYLAGKQADIVCLSWKVRGTPGLGKLWVPGMEPPFVPVAGDRVFGFNIGHFDRRVWNLIGVPRYGWEGLPLELCVDVMAVCGRFNYPQQLDVVGKVLKLGITKSKRGQTLIKKICQPPFTYTQEELREFYAYCIQDVATMEELINALPSDTLEPEQQKVWEMSVKVNSNGLPLDLRAIKRIKQICEFHKERESRLLPELTRGQVKTIGQIAAIREWCAGEGVELDNLQAHTVDEALDQDLPPRVRRVLELRQALGLSSTAKFGRLLELAYNGRVYDNLRYYRAATGRYGGQGFQAHNLPRAKVADPEDMIRKFHTGEVFQEPNLFYCAKALIRSMIRADDGHTFVISDFASIEYVLLLWVAGCHEALERFRAGRDPYRDMAATLFGLSYEDVTKAQRDYAKPPVLGAGYNMGPDTYIAYAGQFGVNVSRSDAEVAIYTYRKQFPEVVSLWYALREKAISAVDRPGQTFVYNRCEFTCIKDRNKRPWLRFRLPSGRALFYSDPKIQDDKYGPVVTYMGMHQKTGQWTRQKLIPGRITENAIQALGWDLLVYCKQEIMKIYPTGLILSVHDETVTMIPDAELEMGGEYVHTRMQTPAPWCPDLPLKAETTFSKRYKKG